MEAVIQFIKRETVLTISGILALMSVFFVPVTGDYLGYIDFRVLALLFCLMGVMAGLQKIGAFSRLGCGMLKKTRSTGQLSFVLVFLCFFSSMFITNDVALITFVPFTILVLEMAGETSMMVRTIVLQTIAANLGSMLTPVGNPQNLYLYSLSGMGAAEFVKLMLPLSAISFFLLLAFVMVGKGRPVAAGQLDMEFEPFQKGKFAGYMLLFVLALLVVVHIVPYQAAFAATVAGLFLLDRRIFRKIDYSLLLTFVFFFIFIGNMGRIDVVSQGLERILEGNELLTSIAASQVISNVPASILLSGFTDNIESLIIGTNLGGLGTLIASLASLISYKYYVRSAGSSKGRYLTAFTGYNVFFLGALSASALLI